MLPAYRIYFEAFVSFVKEFRDEHKFHSVAACMELGEDSRFAARVHLHAYIGFLQKDGATAGLRSAKVRQSDVIFCVRRRSLLRPKVVMGNACMRPWLKACTMWRVPNQPAC